MRGAGDHHPVLPYADDDNVFRICPRAKPALPLTEQLDSQQQGNC